MNAGSYWEVFAAESGWGMFLKYKIVSAEIKLKCKENIEAIGEL